MAGMVGDGIWTEVTKTRSKYIRPYILQWVVKWVGLKTITIRTLLVFSLRAAAVSCRRIMSVYEIRMRTVLADLAFFATPFPLSFFSATSCTAAIVPHIHRPYPNPETVLLRGAMDTWFE